MTSRTIHLLIGALLVTAAVSLGVRALVPAPAAAAVGIDCARIAEDSAARNSVTTHRGQQAITVLGDSYAQGYGLADPNASWPSYLRGSVTVRSLGGTGFVASPCGAHDSYVDRAQSLPRTGLVVVEGGLNDVLATSAQIRRGVQAVVRATGASRTVVVGPANAPRWSKEAARVDRVLAAASAELGVGYVSTYDLDLNYAADGIHLKAAADHRVFAERVNSALS